MLKGQLATAADARIDKTPLGHVSDIMDVPCYAKMVIFVLLVLHGQYLDCWWPDNAGRQGTVLLSKTPYDKISQTQWAHDAVITSLWRQNDVVTSFWRHDDVIITPFVRWEAPRSVVSSPIAMGLLSLSYDWPIMSVYSIDIFIVLWGAFFRLKKIENNFLFPLFFSTETTIHLL